MVLPTGQVLQRILMPSSNISIVIFGRLKFIFSWFIVIPHYTLLQLFVTYQKRLKTCCNKDCWLTSCKLLCFLGLPLRDVRLLHHQGEGQITTEDPLPDSEDVHLPEGWEVLPGEDRPIQGVHHLEGGRGQALVVPDKNLSNNSYITLKVNCSNLSCLIESYKIFFISLKLYFVSDNILIVPH